MMHKLKAILFISILTSTLFLCGCPMPSGNMASDSKINNAPIKKLPYTSNHSQSVLYISQLYHVTDAIIPGMGGASDGMEAMDFWTKITDTQGHTFNLGKLHEGQSFCTYLKPGTYTMQLSYKPHMAGNTPVTFTKKIHVQSNQEKFFAAIGVTHYMTTMPKFRLESLTAKQGHYYVNKLPPKSCQPLEQYSVSAMKTIKFIVSIKNKTSDTIKVNNLGGIDSDKNSKDIPLSVNKTVQLPAKTFDKPHIMVTSARITVNNKMYGLNFQLNNVYDPAMKTIITPDVGGIFSLFSTVKLIDNHCRYQTKTHEIIARCRASVIDQSSKQ